MCVDKSECLFVHSWYVVLKITRGNIKLLISSVMSFKFNVK